MSHLSCFKAYDIRGRLPDELNEDIAWRIGRAIAQFLKPRQIVVGGDIRLSSPALKMSLAEGLRDGGVDVLDIGLCGTEEIYFATSHLKTDGGVMVTASHNPKDYNGMKLVREESKPISGDTGLKAIQALAESGEFESVPTKGAYNQISVLDAYVDHMLSYIQPEKLKPLRLVVNAGNGAAGHALDAIETRLKSLGAPLEFIKVHHEPDGHFPNGIPNPLLPECRQDTADAVLAHNADLGIAWDGDFDRCFFFDEKGQFIEGYYIVGLLGEAFLSQHSGSRIIHDPRLTWNTIDQISEAGGEPVLSKTGHAFIKQQMREVDAVYGGEMSAHHYFRDFAYCDSGMIPWLLMAQLVSEKGIPLSEMVSNRIAKFPSSGEINRKVEDAGAAIQHILGVYESEAESVDHTDGISVEFPSWRFNLRMSNTEPVVRLNVESRGDETLMKAKTSELLALLDA